MSRDLDTATLANAARDYAGQFLLPTVNNPVNKSFAPIAGRGWVLNSMFNFHFKDEFNFVLNEIGQHLGPKAKKDFDDAAAKVFTPRSDDELHRQLADRLAIDPSGKPIPGKIGKVKHGGIILGFTFQKTRGGLSVPRLVHADVHVGETEDAARARAEAFFVSQGVMLFPTSQMPPVMALNTRISNLTAKRACDAVVDSLDDGSGAAVVQGRSGAQPADPDTATSGTNLFTLVCTDPAFGNAADANPGGRATASAVTSDSSADATNTLGYCRASSTNDSITPLTNHIDGEAGTSGADFNFNTLSIVSGATVSLTSWTITMPES
jgi:hypothetical protein